MIAQIGAPVGLRATPSTGGTPAENVSEYVAEDIAEIAEAWSTATRSTANTGVAKLVIRRAFLRRGENFVCLAGFLEPVFR